MPNKATVSGVMQDANLDPVQGGKIVATFVGSDIFDGGVRIVTQKVEATTDDNGEWSMDLIVNAEGENASTSWTIEGFNQYVISVFKAEKLFIASATPVQLGALEKISAANLAAARNAVNARLIVVGSFAEYAALPASMKQPNDAILVTGV